MKENGYVLASSISDFLDSRELWHEKSTSATRQSTALDEDVSTVDPDPMCTHAGFRGIPWVWSSDNPRNTRSRIKGIVSNSGARQSDQNFSSCRHANGRMQVIASPENTVALWQQPCATNGSIIRENKINVIQLSSGGGACCRCEITPSSSNASKTELYRQRQVPS